MFFATLIILQVHSYEISINKYLTQCLGEDITADSLVVSSFKTHENTLGLFVLTILSPDFQIVHTTQKVKEDKFSFIAPSTGPYSFCLYNAGTVVAIVEFDILTGVAAKDFSDLPQAKDIKESEKRTSKVKEAIIELQSELSALKERDIQMAHTNETIGSRVVNYSILTIVMLLVLAVVQTMYLKRFMKNKKMI